jgi:hypothetical protein
LSIRKCFSVETVFAKPQSKRKVALAGSGFAEDLSFQSFTQHATLFWFQFNSEFIFPLMRFTGAGRGWADRSLKGGSKPGRIEFPDTADCSL